MYKVSSAFALTRCSITHMWKDSSLGIRSGSELGLSEISQQCRILTAISILSEGTCSSGCSKVYSIFFRCHCSSWDPTKPDALSISGKGADVDENPASRELSCCLPYCLVLVLRSDDRMCNFVQDRVNNLRFGCFQAICHRCVCCLFGFQTILSSPVGTTHL